MVADQSIAIKCAYVTTSVSRLGGGLFDAVRLLGQSLQKARVDIEVLGLADASTEADLPKWSPLSVKAFDTCCPRAFGYAPGYSRYLDDFNPDMLHCHGLWMYPSVASLRWSKQEGRRYVISPHGMLDSWAMANSHWKKWMAARLFEHARLKGAACLHALCASEALSIRRYGLHKPICIIPNGVEIPTTRSEMPAPWESQVQPGSKVLLYLGRIHPKKGLANLISAWAELKQRAAKQTSPWVLVVAGWGQSDHEKQLKQQARDLQLHHTVKFVGPLFDRAKIAAYENADAFVLPSFSEGLPMVVLEAWAYGLPVVMTPHCNLPEGFSTGAAIRVEPVAGDIARGLDELLSMPDTQRREIGRKGRKLAAEQFSWHTIAARMRSVYEWVLGGGLAPSCIERARAA